MNWRYSLIGVPLRQHRLVGSVLAQGHSGPPTGRAEMHETEVEPPRPPTPGTKAAIALELATLREDLRLIVESVKCEAQKRGWCSDYEYWVRHTNPKLSKPWLLARQFSAQDYRCDICGRDHYV